ncbi:hypothetical protein M5E88_03205 [Akkermansia muciniphila]|nr:hypothetical protein M5E88_03205 [Akkermansia muciniphila]
MAGIISFPGWHWLTKTSGMRVRRGGFVAALAIADERWLKEEYAHQGFQFIWGILLRGLATWNFRTTWGIRPDEGARAGKRREGAKPLVKALTRESLGKALPAVGTM